MNRTGECAPSSFQNMRLYSLAPFHKWYSLLPIICGVYLNKCLKFLINCKSIYAVKSACVEMEEISSTQLFRAYSNSSRAKQVL
jgi:hypothetical protein